MLFGNNHNTLKIASVVQQIITELSGAVSEKDKITVITKMVLNFLIVSNMLNYNRCCYKNRK
jgi:hypothetical protein